MKKYLLLFLFLGVFLFSFNLVSSKDCSLSVNLISQNPYPAVPGGSVNLNFQISGTDNPSCGVTSFSLTPSYPFSLAGNTSSLKKIDGSTYLLNNNNPWMIHYKLKVDKNALDGEHDLYAKYSEGNTNTYTTKKFQVEVNNSLADFEIDIKDFSSQNKILTLQILNIGKTNIKAVRLFVPQQKDIEILKTNSVIAGDLDSNDYTSVDLNAVPKAGNIKVEIYYTDILGIRREINKSVNFNPAYFPSEKKTGTLSASTIIIILLIIFIIGEFFLRRRKANKK